MSNKRHASRLKNNRDKNEKALVELWAASGCVWIQQMAGQGCDGILIAPNGVHIVEIKNPEYKWDLTDTEKETKKMVEFVGQKYNIIENDEQALELVGRVEMSNYYPDGLPIDLFEAKIDF